MFQEIATAIIVNAPLLNIASFLLGLLLGHRYNLWRDRRNELNGAKKPIRQWLVKQLNNPGLAHPLPDIVDIDMLEQMLPWHLRRKFSLYWSMQKEELEKGYYRDPNSGLDYFRNTAERISALKKLMPITNHH